ncbi:putative WD repeat and FYVE domain-containing protein 2 isoform X2, partial [Apostichopus japonicus]
FDDESKHTFVGDYSGTITIIRVADNGHQLVTTLNGHSGSVRSLCWDKNKSFCSLEVLTNQSLSGISAVTKAQRLNCKDIQVKLKPCFFCNQSNQLLSSGEDSRLVVWNMENKRQETPEWQESDICQKCNEPFFWNFKEMWNAKTIGVRQ